MLEFEYARSGLKLGLKLEEKLGANPYKFGMVGSSDAHTGLAAMEEENFFGKTTPQEPSPERLTATFMNNQKTGVKIMDWEVSASGYAAVWANENTRESIWDAMERKETYATTGSRMIVRFFGGWDFEKADAETRSPAAVGYARACRWAVTFEPRRRARRRRFLVAALRDPIGANLDRIQIIKGWIDAKGELSEKVYDVVWGGDRKPDAKGKLPSVGSTVDVANATWKNTIGAPELITVWKDPDFDAKQRAFYYVRVIEIPTPRWTAYDAKRFGVKPLPGTQHDHHRARLYVSDLVHPMKLLEKPLLHFLLLGAAIFGGHRLVAAGRATAPDEIVVTQGRIEALTAAFTRTWQRPPTASEREGLIRDYIREEVYAREAIALGLDKDDIVIRRRLRQKLEFVSEDVLAPAGADGRPVARLPDLAPGRVPRRGAVHVPPHFSQSGAPRRRAGSRRCPTAGAVATGRGPIPTRWATPSCSTAGSRRYPPAWWRSSSGTSSQRPSAELPTGQWRRPGRVRVWHPSGLCRRAHGRPRAGLGGGRAMPYAGSGSTRSGRKRARGSTRGCSSAIP